MNLQEILAEIDQLSPEQLEIVQQYIEAGKSDSRQPAALTERTAGLGHGQIWIAEDFTAELPDSFWLGGE